MRKMCPSKGVILFVVFCLFVLYFVVNLINLIKSKSLQTSLLPGFNKSFVITVSRETASLKLDKTPLKQCYIFVCKLF